jgi:hypothetical protein
MALVGDVSGKHSDLAVRDFARRAGVLSAHATGGVTLLEKAGLIDHQHSLRCGKRLDRIVAHHISQGIRIPAAAS